MTGVRANWHLAELADSDPDPFGAVVYSAGVVLDLTASADELAEQFIALLRVEGRLAALGLTCGWKDDGQDCRTCPHATLDPAQERSRLCRLGKDQSTAEKLCEERTAERRAPFTELAARADEASLIGRLDDDLVELLTAVGL